ncbi:eukaryotic translation initiation factor 4 gamma 3, partial [Biomphalaria glabrata]
MNRLTPSNFKKLAEEMMALEITTFEDLELVVSTVFDKVAIETKFVQAYASLCQVMLGLQVEPPPTIPKNKATFRAILVTKCQKAFEADKSVIFESAEEIKKRIMEEMKEDTPSRAEKIETTLYQMKLSQMKFFGNISFICELFKLGILPEVIIHSCITKLLSCTDDESLFSLCRLITAVGKHIDTKKSKAQIDKYFTRITQLAAISKSRLKFALSDVLDLRKNKWVPRTKTTGPKTLEEIHKDFKEEQSVSESPKPKPKKPLKREATTDIRPSTTTRASKTSNPAEVKEDKRQCKAGNDSDKENECNWTQVKSKGKASQSKKQTGKISKEKKQADAGRFAKKNEMPPNTATKTFDVIPEVSDDFTVRKMEKKGSAESTLRYDLSDSENEQLEEPKVESIDFSRFKLSKSKVEDDDIILAPRGKTMFSFLSRPSQENKSTSKTKNTEERIENKTNRFSLLLDVSTDESLDAVLSEEPKQRASKVNAKSIQSGAGVSNKIKKLPFVENPKQGTVSPQVVVKLSEDELQTKTLSIIDEFINCRDKKEACLCIDELKSRADMNQFITVTVNHVLEKTDGIRQQIGELFDDLLKTQIITVEDVTKGFSEVMVFAEDIVIDVPKLWAYLAQLIAPLLNHTLLWSNLEPMICCHLQPKNSAIMLAHILKLLLDKQMTVAEIQKGWNASSLNWTQFMEQDRVVEFLDERGINQIFSTSECKEREINSVDTLDSNIDHCEIVDTLCERPEPQKDSSERPEPQIDSSERPEPQIDSNESSEPQIDSSESSEPQVDSSEITVGHGQMDATEIVSSQIECDIQLECDNIFKNESESMPVELKIPNISITGEDCLIKYPTSEMPNLEPVVGSASLLTSDLVMAQHFNNSPSDVVVCENSFSNELLETADENDGRQIDQDTRSEFSDEEGFETWSREMEEDEAGFFISCYTSEAGAKKLFVCRLPFEIAGSDEEEEDGGEDMADDETVIRSFLNDTTQAKSLTDYKVVSGNENLRNCLHRDISASQHDSSSVLEATAHNGSGTSSPQRDSLCLGEMYADLAQNKWSSVYLDPSALQYLEADNTESISSQPIDFNSTNMGFISSIPNDSTRIKAYPIRSNCTADGILRSQHPDGYIWGNKLYTFEDHKRYLQSLEKSIINLSSDAPWFNSGRPAASSGDKTSVAVIKPDDSSGDKISVDAPCFVPGRPVASSGDKISVDAPCFVPGRPVASSGDKISVDAPCFVPGRPVASSGDKISVDAPCFVPGRPVASSGDKISVDAPCFVPGRPVASSGDKISVDAPCFVPGRPVDSSVDKISVDAPCFVPGRSVASGVEKIYLAAPCFVPGRPVASSGDKISVNAPCFVPGRPVDSSGDKISVDAPCFVPGRPVDSSVDKISVDAPCFVPGRSVDSSVDKISVDAPYFVPGRPVASSGDTISVNAPCFVPGRPVDSSGDKISVDAPCFVPGRPVDSSVDKISVDAPCFVPGRSVDSSVDKISVDAPCFVPGRPVDSSGDKISLAAPCFVPGRPVDSSGDKNSVAAASCRDDYMNGPLPLQDQAEVFLGNSVNKRQQNNFSNSACDLKQNIDSSCHFQTSFQNYNFSPGCIASNHSTSGQTSASNSMQFNFSQKPPEHPRQSCSNTYVRGVSNYGFSSVGSDLSNLSINQPKKVGVSTFGFDAVSTNKSHYTNVARDDLRATSSNASVNCAIDHSSILNMFLGRSQTSSSQLSVDVLSYLALSQAAASSLETMLRNKSSNQDIIQFIKEAIVGKVLDGALLSIFMTALACSFLNDVKESIVKERKEIISFVLARDVSKEMEAIQILNLVLCQFGYPQGISVLLQELVTEEL